MLAGALSIHESKSDGEECIIIIIIICRRWERR